MKKTILILILSIIFPLLASSQSFKVGQYLLSDNTFVMDSSLYSYSASRQFNFGQAQLFPFDINKDNIPDFNIYLWWYDQYIEYIYNTGINTINSCQVIPIEEGTDLESINWNQLPKSPDAFVYRYGRMTPVTISESHGLCLTNPKLYLAFRIVTVKDSGIIIGWMEIYATDINLYIKRYAYLSRKVPEIISRQRTGAVNGKFTLNVTFPKPVQGFDSLDLNVTNGVVSSFSAINSAEYAVEISPLQQGPVTVDVPAHVAYDQDDNFNAASLIFSTLYETNRPVVNIQAESSNDTIVNGVFNVSISFVEHFEYAHSSGYANEVVCGFKTSMLQVTNGIINKLDSIGAGYYRATIAPAREGILTIDVADNVVKDLAGNWNVASKQFRLTVDFTPPIVAISKIDSVSVNHEFYILLTFSENIEYLSDINVENGFSEFGPQLSSGRLFKITPLAENVRIILYPHSFKDAAGNWNTDTTAFKVILDMTHPTVTISIQDTSPFNKSFFAIFTFSEPVASFSKESISIKNGILEEIDSISPSIYSGTIILPQNADSIIVFVPEGVVQDMSGNRNAPSNRLSIYSTYAGIETQTLRSVKIYPNPSSGVIAIGIDEPKSFNTEIFNINGLKVYYKKNTVPYEKIDLSFLNDGIYFIKFGNSDFLHSRKLIIHKNR
jgi:Secretion system C-terminal sorting domain/Bacterial Ig-like domain